MVGIKPKLSADDHLHGDHLVGEDISLPCQVVAGKPAPNMIPWQVVVYTGSGSMCGGTIIDACTILSAAHCEITTDGSIRAGSRNNYNGGQVC